MHKKNKQIIIVLLFICSLALISNAFVSFSNAQTNGEAISVSTNLEFFEYSEIEGTKVNISSINIELLEPNWTITNIQLNITDISLGSEIVVIEDSETNFEQVANKNPSPETSALGTQLEVLEDIDLFGVFIKGYKTQANETIKFQLQGYDEGNNSPNNTIYRSIDLNISTDPLGWYYQDFSSGGSDPIELTIGNYSLVMNGTDLPVNSDARYNWYKNEGDPQIPYLYTSSYKTSWSTGIINTSFLCKLNQRVDETYLPTDLDMTAEFNGDDYVIPDSGNLEIANLTHFSEETDLSIPLIINKSVTLNFNYNYSVNLLNEFLTESSAIIKESNNQWSLSPIISRISQNYYIRFNIPRNWYNFSIYRKLSSTWENVTSMVNFDLINRTINIPNNTIEDGSEWWIIAFSPNINFDLNFPNIEWEPGQELQFTVNLPVVDGNLTFNLINPIGFGLEEPIVKEVVSEETFFTYLIPSYSIEGTYIAKIFWNNATDIGFQSQEFTINIPFVLDPMIIIIIVVGIVIISITAFTSYKLVKRSRRIRDEYRKRIFNKYMDVMNLDYFIISEKESGLTIFDQLYAGKDIDSSLISGFLQAIRRFGIELTNAEEQSQTIKLDYMNLKILMSEFKNFRILLLMKDNPSHEFLESIKTLSYEIEKKYGEAISKFDGNLLPFGGIKELLEEHLVTSLLYPLKVIEQQVKISPVEKSMISKAQSMMKLKNADYFFVSNLLSTKKGFQVKDAEIILKLINKKIFQPKI